MKKVLLASTALLTLVSNAAMAADLSKPPRAAPVYTKAPIMPVYNWTGCYVGGHVGGAWSQDQYTLDNGAGLVESFSFNPNSVIGGGQLGCQVQVNSFVFGAEGTWSGLDLKQTDNSVLSPGRQRSLKLDEIATVAGRAGFTAGNWLFYAKGGWADARIETFAINPATNVSIDLTSWQSGWVAGGGVEWMVWQSFVLGGEFNYYSFKFDRTGIATDGTTSKFFNTNANVYSALVRASYLFNIGR
jgi:outer membrane immunogenic protein